MKIDWMHHNRLCTEIDVDYRNNTVHIVNHTDSIFDRAFGINESPSIEDFEDLLVDRGIPQTRHHFSTEMKLYGIQDTSPLGIAMHFNGRIAGDNFWMKFYEEEFDESCD